MATLSQIKCVYVTEKLPGAELRKQYAAILFALKGLSKPNS